MNSYLISKYRSNIYGLSALLIVLLHILEFGNWSNGIWYYLGRGINTLFSLGVPIFSFLSGVSLYFSLQKKQPIKEYYLKRFHRVFLPYLIVAGIYYAVIYLILQFDPGEFVLQLSTVAFWTKHGSAWYVAMLVPVYLLGPFYSRWVEKGHRGLKTVLAIAILFAIMSWLNLKNTDAYLDFYLLLRTVCVFVIGYYTGESVYERNNDKRVFLSFSFLPIIFYIILGGVYKATKLYFSPLLDLSYASIGISASFILAFIFEKSSTICEFHMLKKIGAVSLESYIFNTYLMKVLHHLDDYYRFSDLMVKALYFLIVGVLGILFSFSLKKILNYIIKERG